MIGQDLPKFENSNFKRQMDLFLGRYDDFVEADFHVFNEYEKYINYKGNLVYRIELSNTDFVNIYQGDEYYGGDQNWLSVGVLNDIYQDISSDDSSQALKLNILNKRLGSVLTKPDRFFRQRGCGSIAAANILTYNSIIDDKLSTTYFGYEKTKMKSKRDYLVHMLYVLCFAAPKIYGMPMVSVWINGVKRAISELSDVKISKVHTHKMTGRIYSRKYARARAKAFIQYHLHEDRPIACLHLGFPQRKMINFETENNGRMYDMSYHWVTITEIMCDDRGKTFVAVSTWGKKMIFDIDVFLDGFPSFVTVEFD